MGARLNVQNAKTYDVTATLYVGECGMCHIIFGMPHDLERRARADRDVTFYCPNGHSLHYVGETEAERLAKRLDVAQADIAYWRELQAAEVKKHTATKGQLTKVRKRIAGGICPDCNRHFANVEAHMASRHGGPGKDGKPAPAKV